MIGTPTEHITFFDAERVSRMIALGFPKDQILPHFEPLIRGIIKSKVSYDKRNHTEDDLVQVGLLKCIEIIDKFSCKQGNLFAYSVKLIKHALWSEARLRPLDHQRVSDEVDFDETPGEVELTRLADDVPLLDESILAKFRLDDPALMPAAQYVFGVLTSNDYESNRARVLKTLTHGYDVNPKHARFLADHVLVTLRKHYSQGPDEVRDDRMFDNKFKHTLVPELRDLLGERAFEKLIHFFGGLTISVPSVQQIQSIDRDLAILKALALDWTCGPSLSKKFSISPEGIKAVYKACLHKLHSDPEFRELVAEHMDLSSIPGYEEGATPKAKKKKAPTFGEKRVPPKRKLINTDSMGFTLGCRNSLLYTAIVTGNSTRTDLVQAVMQRFGGTESAAKATVSAFLSDIKHPFGKFNTSRNLQIVVDAQGRLKFTKESLEAARKVIAEKRQAQMLEEC